ncbi:MAG TPA: hydantoinase/oxoprolinase family protein [Xanthobacteraceae bacterium]|nr:hydantoinase/oxoprolinase family protein [Xanthobacteraceae bacterium]
MLGAVIGWDIGGAHLKAARVENGRVVKAVQIPSPLRLGVASVDDALAQATALMGIAERHAVTMTGELADTFQGRREGVEVLSAVAARHLSPLMLYAGRAGFIAPQHASEHVADIASANWHASTAFVAQAGGTALFADMGSTTTDLVPVRDGAIVAGGYTDAERLAAGELVYTGLVRSPVMTIARHAPVTGQWTPLVNEHFATMADVHRILGALPADADQMTTADGRDKTRGSSRARLARIVGRDAADLDDAAWLELARWFAEAQMRTVTDAAMLVLSRGHLPADAAVVGAGIGETVLHELARRLGRPYVSFVSFLDVAPDTARWASHCAPAAALAVLASQAEPNRLPGV